MASGETEMRLGMEMGEEGGLTGKILLSHSQGLSTSNLSQEPKHCHYKFVKTLLGIICSYRVTQDGSPEMPFSH